jgi:PAS domain S-box-containing protein
MQLRIDDMGTVESQLFAQTQPSQLTNKRLVEKFDPPALSLDERGMILDCSKSLEKLLGFRRSELVWHHVSMLFSQLEGVELVQGGQVNSLLNYLCRCGQLYQVKNRQGETFSSNLNLFRIENQGKRILRLIVHDLVSELPGELEQTSFQGEAL